MEASPAACAAGKALGLCAAGAATGALVGTVLQSFLRVDIVPFAVRLVSSQSGSRAWSARCHHSRSRVQGKGAARGAELQACMQRQGHGGVLVEMCVQHC